MKNSVLHHLGIGLVDPRAAEPFFDRLFVDFLGLAKEPTQEAVAGWKGRGTRFYLYPARDGAVPGALQHLAFNADSRDEIHRFCDWAKRNGVALRGEPRPYPEYGGDYYAVFFDGPESLRLELVHLSESEDG